jgi:HK97 family phage major capsid protein
MKITRNHLTLGFLAGIAVLAVLAIAGHPLIPPEALAGLGMIPFSGEIDLKGIHDVLTKQGDAFDAWKKKQEAKLEDLESTVLDVAKKAGRPSMGLNADHSQASTHETWVDAKSKRPVQVLTHGDRLAAVSTKSGDQSGTKMPSMGRVMRGLVLGGRADDHEQLADERKAMSISSDPAGGYTVGGSLAGEWIDLVRAEMVLSRAGARTIPMDAGELTIAKVTGDPTISWHVENQPLPESEPTFGAVTLRSKTVVCHCKLSLELSQDSANIEQMLQSVIVKSMANAIDSCGINGVSTNPTNAPAGIAELAGRNTVTSIGAPTSWDFVTDGMYELLADNMPMTNIGALVAHPALWKKMRKLKTGISGDNTPLTAPDEVAKLPKLWTTAAPLVGGTTAKGIIADWRDLLFGVRRDITVHVLREAHMGSNLQIGVLAYARVDFVATRAASFCTLEDITVA